jgi:hypothetical protein
VKPRPLLSGQVPVKLADLPESRPRHRDAPAAVDVARRQVDGIARWQESARGCDAAEDSLVREQEVIAIVTAHHLLGAGAPLRTTSAARAVVAHRHDWFAEAVSMELTRSDVSVIGRAWDAGAAVGFCVAEQPDLVLLDSGLGLPRLVQRLHELCPHTAVVVQFNDDDEQHALALAGATALVHRRVSPREVAAQATLLLARQPRHE